MGDNTKQRLGTILPPIYSKDYLEQQGNYDTKGYIAKYGTPDQSKGQHLTDEFKLPTHITFSSDSRYHSPTFQGGTWTQDKNEWSFTPSQHNLKLYSPDQYRDYFSKYETKDTSVILPGGIKVYGTKKPYPGNN